MQMTNNLSDADKKQDNLHFLKNLLSHIRYISL